MEFIALKLEIKHLRERKEMLCLCVHDEPKVLTTMVSSYPIEDFDQFIQHDDKEYRVLAQLSDTSNPEIGVPLDESTLFWCDPQEPGLGSRNRYSSIDKYLTNRPAWIMGKVFIKSLVYRIV